MNETFWRSFFEYVRDGGFVMPPLVVATIILWLGLGWRLATLQRGSIKPLRKLVTHYKTNPNASTRGVIDDAVKMAIALKPGPGRVDQLDESFGPLHDRMGRFQILVKSIVMVAPLTGLLGTVSGMIETFDSLADMSLFSQSGGIAGGISQALITTQMGLAVAIPGLIFGRILDRKQRLLEDELDELKHLMVQEDA